MVRLRGVAYGVFLRLDLHEARLEVRVVDQRAGHIAEAERRSRRERAARRQSLLMQQVLLVRVVRRASGSESECCRRVQLLRWRRQRLELKGGRS